MEKGFPPFLAKFLRRFRKTPPALLLSALALLSASPRSALAASPESLARLGNSAYYKKDFSKAYEHYSKALEKSPKNARILFNRGAAFYRMEDYAKAAEDFEEAAKTPKFKSAADYNAGNAYYKMSDLAKAIEKYRSAIISGRGDTENARYNLQKALEQQKQNQNQCKNNKPDQKKQEQEQKPKQEDKSGGKDQEKKDQAEQKKKEAARQQADKLLELMKEREKSSGNREMMNARFNNKPQKKKNVSEKDW